MIKNIGKQDRNLRYAAGGLLLVAALFTQSWLLGIIGLVLVGTAYVGTCGAYIPFKIDTRKSDEG